MIGHANSRFYAITQFEQIAILPTFGFIRNGTFWKYAIAFFWLCFNARIGFVRRRRDDE